MLLYFLALSVTAAILGFNNPRSVTIRWAALFLLFASLGGLAYWLREISIYTGGQIRPALTVLYYALNFINQTMTPYGVLMFSLMYVHLTRTEWTRRLGFLLLLPVVGMMVTVPFSDYGWELDPVLLLVWAGPYYAASCVLLLYGYWREKDAYARRHHRITLIIMVPTLAAIIGFILVARVLNPQFDFFSYVSVFVTYSLIAGIALSFFTGVLGVRLRLEHEPLDAAWKLIRSGTAVFNHSIKNEIGKISISTHNLQQRLPDSAEYQGPLDIIARSAGHLEAMAERIHTHTREIILQEEPVRLAEVVEGSLKRMDAAIQSRHFEIISEIPRELVIIMDPTHMREVIGNIIENSVEATPDGGRMEISSRMDRRGRIVLAITDNGEGIPAEVLKNVTRPFFSTRNHSRNYGLGLSYCRLVMELSGGKLHIDSTFGRGTTVELEFARRKRVGG
ncbi:sensor histidine kinase [Paenibacillus eucommiae]|uniref:histidine kinase n=1 Tax=Paenibacillus eucommiae TaxID=1355755 RepID=A0ABS4IS25_9BACL|nr:sensor histidine kinase [Paenibacillus eucommiae]MBP1990328.1 signal transduction histidine kinase [Paenibacillus eucommiae]